KRKAPSPSVATDWLAPSCAKVTCAPATPAPVEKLRTWPLKAPLRRPGSWSTRAATSRCGVPLELGRRSGGAACGSVAARGGPAPDVDGGATAGTDEPTVTGDGRGRTSQSAPAPMMHARTTRAIDFWTRVI